MKNIYVSTYTTFELIMLMYQTERQYCQTRKWQWLKRKWLKRKKQLIIKGFLSRELSEQADVLIGVLYGTETLQNRKFNLYHKAKLYSGALKLYVEFKDHIGEVLYDAKRKSFDVDVDPILNNNNGYHYTIVIGQHSPRFLSKSWTEDIVPVIEEIFIVILNDIIEFYK